MHASNSTFKLDLCKCDVTCDAVQLHLYTLLLDSDLQLAMIDMICELFLGISAMHAMICVWESSKQLIAMLHSARFLVLK